jgi:outer membrane protein assembly factor BamA
MLLEQNFFKRAERVLLFGNYSDIQQTNSASIIFPGFSLSATADRLSYTEYLFADGAYSAKDFDGKELSKLAGYGPIADSYQKDISGMRINAGKAFGDSIRGTVGFNSYDIKYSNGLNALPADAGRINSVQASVSFGKFESRLDMLYNFGRIFGLGMADLEDRLKPLICVKTDYGFQLAAEDGGSYTKFTASADRLTTFCDKGRLSLFVKGGAGTGIPDSQLFATNRRDGMLGTYAREFRGDRIAVSNIDYRHPFIKDKTGQLIGEAFAEFASAYGNQWNSKEGAGINLTYQFWRFPLPLGFGYTYSFDDNDWQVSASIGGAF